MMPRVVSFRNSDNMFGLSDSHCWGVYSQQLSVQLSVTLSHTQEEMGDKGGEGRDLGLSVTKKGRLVTLSIVY